MIKRKPALIGALLVIIVVLAYLGVSQLRASAPTASGSGSVASQPEAVAAAPAGGDVSGEGALVEVPVDKLQLIGVKTVEAKTAPLTKTIRTVGRVQYDERKLKTVNIKVEGWVEKLHADYAGKYVAKGAPLAEIYSPELYSAALELSNLMDWKTNKAHRFQRNIEFRWGDRYGTTGQMLTFDLDALIKVAKQKLALWEVPEDQIADIEKGEEPPKTFTLVSPASGYVFQKAGFPGTKVNAGDKLFDIVDLSTVWVLADIYEFEIPIVKPGLQGRITTPVLPDQEIAAKLDFIYPSLSAQSRTAKARFVVPNSKLGLKPQMFVNVEIAADLGKRLIIPESAVIDSGTRSIVYVDKGQGFFEPRRVWIGIRGDRMVEVTRGLKAGERVVATATFLIDSEARLKGIVP